MCLSGKVSSDGGPDDVGSSSPKVAVADDLADDVSVLLLAIAHPAALDVVLTRSATNWTSQRLGSFVGARGCYKDSNAPTLIKIGGILTIVFVI